MKWRYALLITFGWLVLLSWSPWVGLAAAVVIPLAVVKFDSWSMRRREYHRLLTDCEQQHAALMRGNDSAGLFGRFPCPQIDAACADTPPSGG